MPRIAVFTGNLSYSVRKGIAEIDAAIPGLAWLIVVHAPSKPVGKLLRSQWRNLRRNGWRWIPYQAADLWGRFFSQPPPVPPRSAPGFRYLRSSLEAQANVRFLRSANIHAPETLEAVKAFAPTLGLSLAAPILREPLFSIPELGTLNLHKGKVPHYRGMPPAFWELWNDESSVGCTVHKVDAKLDTGEVVAEAAVPRRAYSTVRGLQLCLDETGIGLMRESVAAALAGRTQGAPQAPGGKTYRKPTLAQSSALDRKLLANQVPRGAAPLRMLKDAFCRGWLALHRAGLGRLRGPHVTVLLFHRVSDEARDNLTVGIEQFDRLLSLLVKHCQVLTIEEVAAAGPLRPSARPRVCVTFDDGYLDNYEHAVPLLLRHGVPAAFFVSTGIIGTDGQFPHDKRRGNPALPVMGWEQLRNMRDHGFTIGSHTVNHIDCAAEPEDTVKAELAASREDLRRELGLRDAIFAYPYGGKKNMTPERLELVKQAGYSACLSAYGAINFGNVDRFNVLRAGIHWEFSDPAFLCRCYGRG